MGPCMENDSRKPSTRQAEEMSPNWQERTTWQFSRICEVEFRITDDESGQWLEWDLNLESQI